MWLCALPHKLGIRLGKHFLYKSKYHPCIGKYCNLFASPPLLCNFFLRIYKDIVLLWHICQLFHQVPFLADKNDVVKIINTLGHQGNKPSRHWHPEIQCSGFVGSSCGKCMLKQVTCCFHLHVTNSYSKFKLSATARYKHILKNLLLFLNNLRKPGSSFPYIPTFPCDIHTRCNPYKRKKVIGRFFVC